jgi:hypothetical protein
VAAPASEVEVRLSAEQRAALGRVVHTGTRPARARRRACILPRAGADGPDRWPDERIAEALGVNRMTVSRVRAQFACEGIDATLHKKRAKNRQYRKLDGAQEARLVAPTCSDPPQGQARRAAQLLADKLVELQVVGSVDPTTAWRALQKTNSSRG